MMLQSQRKGFPSDGVGDHICLRNKHVEITQLILRARLISTALPFACWVLQSTLNPPPPHSKTFSTTSLGLGSLAGDELLPYPALCSNLVVWGNCSEQQCVLAGKRKRWHQPSWCHNVSGTFSAWTLLLPVSRQGG